MPIGDIAQAQGRLDDALAAFREYLAISQRLAATDPSNAGWQRDLAVAHSRVGDIRQRAGPLDDALAASANTSPSPSASPRPTRPTPAGSATSPSLIPGRRHRREQGRLDDALAAFREYLAISQRLAATDPSNAGWQRELAVAHRKVGDIQRKRRAASTTRWPLRRSISPSPSASPRPTPPTPVGSATSPSLMPESATSRMQQGRLDDALAAFREVLAISRRLAATDPSNAGWQRDLAVAHSKVGDVAIDQRIRMKRWRRTAIFRHLSALDDE